VVDIENRLIFIFAGQDYNRRHLDDSSHIALSTATRTKDVLMQTQLKIYENEEIERAATKPGDFLKTCLEDAKNGGRDAALLVTKEDVLSLKRYESYGLNLPHTLETVQLQLGITSSGIPGLEPSDIMNTHSAINLHALSWAPLEAKIKDIGYDLDRFATTFHQQGKGILSIIEKMDVVSRIKTRVDQLTREMIEEAVPTPLNETDKSTTAVLSTYLASLAEGIERQKLAATSLRDQLTVFVTTIRTKLIPDVSQKLDLVKNSDLERQIKELTTDIDSLSKEIDQKNKEYTQAKNSIAWGVMGGPIGVAITGGIFGSKAERIRKEKNRLISEKNSKIKEVNTKQPISAAIRRLELQFDDMYIRLEDARQSASHLEDLWSMLANYIKGSAEDLEKISDSQTLLIFTLQFRAVITPWELLGGFTTRLLQIFESALDQYKLEQK
jgi:hypothetical protein